MFFRELIPEDQKILNEYIKNINNYQTDFSVATILLFQDFQNPEISIQEIVFLLRDIWVKKKSFFPRYANLRLLANQWKK